MSRPSSTSSPLGPIEAILRDCFRDFATLQGARSLDRPDVDGAITSVPLTFFNGIAATRLSAVDDGGADLNAAIEEVMRPFRAARMPFRWWISPSTRQSGLPAALAAHGMRHGWDAPAMTADLRRAELEAEPPAGLTIRRVMNEDDMRDWAAVLVPVFHRPEAEGAIWRDAYALCGFGPESTWTHLVGYVDDRPVATVSMLHAGPLAGVYHVASVPEVRGRGIGTALTRAGMRVGAERGAETAVLQASELGLGVYRALGFEVGCTLTLYDWRPEYDG